MVMPRRPREHVVEQESRDAFRAALPAEWTVAASTDDYGIDSRVEIFADGSATGLAFGAQLKATDETNLRKALTARIDVATLNYMHAHAEPVLLVRYHAPTGRLYGQWLHRKDVVLKRAGQKTYTFAWTETDRLGPESADLLMEEVRRYRRFSAANLDGVTVRVAVEPPLDRHASSVSMLLASAAKRTGGFLAFDGPGPHDAYATVGQKMLRVDMSVASARIEFHAPGAAPGDLAANLLVACAVCLARVGRPDVAATIAADVPDAPVLANEEVAALVASAFAAARRWREASDLSRRHRTSLFAVALQIELLLSDGLSPAELRHIADNMVGAAEDADADHDRGSASEWYSAGNFLFHRVHDYPAALAAYENAARAAGSDYERQAYYLGELGAAQHETGAYEQAVDTYARVIAADPGNTNVLACRADSLTRAGRYREALEEFDKYEQAAGPDDLSQVWELMAGALRHVVAVTGIGAQDRAAAGPDGVPPDDLTQDALSPLAWLDAAQQATEDGRDIAAMEAVMVMCAYPAPGYPEPWHVILPVVHVLGRDDLFDRLITAAWRREGERLPALLLDHMIADPEALPGLLNAVKEKIEELRAMSNRTVDFRFVDRDGHRDTIRFGGLA